MFFKPTRKISDSIFPLVRASRIKAGRFEYNELIGTGFLIGKRSYALTAAHVIEQCFDNLKDNEVVLGLFAYKGNWYVKQVETTETHPTEDVGIIKMGGDYWPSFISICHAFQNATSEYHCWGYPRAIAKEIQLLVEDSKEQPDLIFTQGYVRRRISRELYPVHLYRGNQFYELSEQSGEGTSGAPIILKTTIGKMWECFGIYIGEKEAGNISYAVRAEAFIDWKPNLLAKTIREEANAN